MPSESIVGMAKVKWLQAARDHPLTAKVAQAITAKPSPADHPAESAIIPLVANPPKHSKPSAPSLAKEAGSSMGMAELLSLVFSIIGGMGLLFVNFWAAVSFFDIGAIALAILLLFEKAIVRRLVSVPWIILASLINVFLLHPSDMGVVAVQMPDDFPNLPDGMPRRPDLTYIHISLLNMTGDDFSDVDLEIKPNAPIVAIGMYPSVQTTCALHGDLAKEMIKIGTVTIYRPTVTDSMGKPMALRQLSTPEYRIVCSKIVKGSSTEMIAAVARLNRERSNGNGVGNIASIHALSKNKEDFGTVFLGSLNVPEGDFVYDKVSATVVSITGTYVAHFKPMKAAIGNLVTYP